MNLYDSILLTLSFFDALDFAPSKDKLRESLFFCDIHSSDEFRAVLQSLSARVTIFEDLVVFRGREELISLRREKQKQASKLWRKVNRWKWLFSLLPGLRMVCVCNNLAFGNVTEKSDMDLFVVAKRNRLFLVRFWMIFLVHIFGLRRHGKKQAGRFCLSFFASEDDLNFSPLQIEPGKDFYLAFWSLSLQPIFGEEFFKNFMKKNLGWLSSYYNSAAFSALSGSHEESFLATEPRKTAFSKLNDVLENFLATWQLHRAEMKRKRLPVPEGTMLTRTLLKFHDHDRRREFSDQTLKRFNYAVHRSSD